MTWTNLGRQQGEDITGFVPGITLGTYDNPYILQFWPSAPSSAVARVRDGLFTCHLQFPPFSGNPTFYGSGREVYLCLPKAYEPKDTGITYRTCGQARSIALNQSSSFVVQNVRGVTANYATFNFISAKSGTLTVLSDSNYTALLRQFFGEWGSIDISLEYEI